MDDNSRADDSRAAMALLSLGNNGTPHSSKKRKLDDNAGDVILSPPYHPKKKRKKSRQQQTVATPQQPKRGIKPKNGWGKRSGSRSQRFSNSKTVWNPAGSPSTVSLVNSVDFKLRGCLSYTTFAMLKTLISVGHLQAHPFQHGGKTYNLTLEHVFQFLVLKHCFPQQPTIRDVLDLFNIVTQDRITLTRNRSPKLKNAPLADGAVVEEPFLVVIHRKSENQNHAVLCHKTPNAFSHYQNGLKAFVPFSFKHLQKTLQTIMNAPPEDKVEILGIFQMTTKRTLSRRLRQLDPSATHAPVTYAQPLPSWVKSEHSDTETKQKLSTLARPPSTFAVPPPPSTFALPPPPSTALPPPASLPPPSPIGIWPPAAASPVQTLPCCIESDNKLNPEAQTLNPEAPTFVPKGSTDNSDSNSPAPLSSALVKKQSEEIAVYKEGQPKMNQPLYVIVQSPAEIRRLPERINELMELKQKTMINIYHFFGVQVTTIVVSKAVTSLFQVGAKYGLDKANHLEEMIPRLAWAFMAEACNHCSEPVELTGNDIPSNDTGGTHWFSFHSSQDKPQLQINSCIQFRTTLPQFSKASFLLLQSAT